MAELAAPVVPAAFVGAVRDFAIEDGELAAVPAHLPRTGRSSRNGSWLRFSSVSPSS